MAYMAGGAHGGNEEKAYDNRRNAQNENNTSSRPLHGSSSRFAHSAQKSRYEHSDRRSRSPYRAPREKSRSPYRADRDRSRSPYRAPKGKTGEKRYHPGDHYSAGASDTRRFKAHYDDDDEYMIYAGLRKTDQDNRRYDDPKAPSKYSGREERDRSRSPYRRNKLPSSKTTAAAVADGNQDNGRSDVQTIENDVSGPAQQLSDAELIEQRRKRREAIKARHKQQPLLVQALEQNITSAPNTPVHESSAIGAAAGPPSSIGSPSTPAIHSPGSPAPMSPASLSAENMDDLVEEHRVVDANADAPSAADYDPTMDMREDRRDLQQATQSFKADQRAAAKRPTESDMFADDDDDMFASDSKAVAKTLTQEARTLDQSLLDNWDYPDGHYRVIVGELLDGKYAVQQQIGKGTFATVVRARETAGGGAVAIKIACNNDTMYKAGTRELDFLTTLNESDPEDKRHIIRLLGKFDHKGHMCLVFESLNADLRETLKKYGRNVGLNLVALRSFAHQMFQALLHMQRNEILHADLKPDNILVSEKLNLLKICDLGTASKIEDAEVTPYLVSRFYRAPEVMLGMPLDYAIDMWSIGCTLFELYTGRILFAGSDNNQMLKAIQECRGKIPNRMLKKSTLFDRHFDQFGNFISIERDKITGQTAMRQPNLTKIANGKDLRSRVMASIKDAAPATIKEAQAFADLLDKCLQLDPARRISPTDALKHHFITRIMPSQEVEKKKLTALAPARVK